MKRSSSTRAGYTLLELIVSLLAASFLLAGLASSLYLAGQMLTPPQTVETSLSSTRAASDIVDELRYAVYITERSATSIGFAVADRTGDGQPDVVRYSWSGEEGDPLQRSMNGGTAVSVLGDVHAFGLEYTTRSVTESVPVYEDSPEQVLASVTSNPSPAEHAVLSTAWAGQYFKPVLPAGTPSYRITRISLNLKQNGTTTGAVRVQVRPASGGKPTSTILGEVTQNESTLPATFGTMTYNYASLPEIAGTSGACIVLQYAVGPEACGVRYVSTGMTTPDSAMVTSSNNGASWTSLTSRALEYVVYGTYKAQLDPLVITRTYLTGVELTLQTSESTQARVHTTAALLNTPEVLGKFWETDFDAAPTAVDINYDQTGDWVRRDGQAFNPSSLNTGLWTADSTLDTSPGNDFATMTTAEVRMRNTSIGGSGAVFWINADWSNGTAIPIYATLQRLSNGTQTLTFYRKTDASTSVALKAVTGLNAGYVDLKIAIDPSRNIVALWVGTTSLGAFAYTPFSLGNSDRFASVYASGSGAEFDYVSVRVSEPAP